MRRISEDFLHNSIIRFIILSAVTGRVLSPLSGAHTPNLNMLSRYFFYILIPVVLGLGLAIPSNTYIVIVYLESLRKKEKLSPSDVIFMAKGIVNILLEFSFALQGVIFLLPHELYSNIINLKYFSMISVYFLTFYSFWLTAWLSAHYCTSITNLSYGIFIWIKRIVSNFLTQALLLTALGTFLVSFLTIWVFNKENDVTSSDNSTMEASVTYLIYYITFSYYIPLSIQGCVLPFSLSLLCLVLTFFFLVRHVWRVKNNDSGSTRPKFQAYVTALGTIFFLLLISIFFCISQVLVFILKFSKSIDTIYKVIWTF
ncbi:taste receptor type 2 member 41-like [Mantella aurantiaca]